MNFSRTKINLISYETNREKFHQHKIASISSILLNFENFLPLTATTNDVDDHDDNYSGDFPEQLHPASCTIRISFLNTASHGLATLDHRLSFVSDESPIRQQIIRVLLAFKVVYINVGIS
jgi:hypothetical protein